MTTLHPRPTSLKAILATPRSELLNGPDFDWTRTRAVRRRLAAAHVALSVAAGLLLGFAIEWRTIWLLGGVVALLPIFIFVIGSLNASVRGIADLGSAKLDEWQLSRRDAMFRICWWPVVSMMGLVGFVAAMTPAPEGLKAGLAMGAFFLALCLPLCALAWTLPEEPDPEA